MSTITLEVGVPLSGYPFTSIASARAYMNSVDPDGVPLTNTWIINLHAGTYNENVDLRNIKGTALNTFTLKAQAGDTVIIDGGVGVTTIYNTLATTATIGDLTISLTNASAFPSSGVITIHTRVNSETMEDIQYTGKTGNNLTGCTRGYNGTTPSAHTAGCFVSTGAIYAVNFNDSAFLTVKDITVQNFFRDGIMGFRLTNTCTITGCKAYPASPWARAFTIDGSSSGFDTYILDCFVDVNVACSFIYQIAGANAPLIIENLTFVGHEGGEGNTGTPEGTDPSKPSNYSIGLGGGGGVVRNSKITNGYLELTGDSIIDSNKFDQSMIFNSGNMVCTNNLFVNSKTTNGIMPYGGWRNTACSVANINAGVSVKIYNNTFADKYVSAPILCVASPSLALDVKNNIFYMTPVGYAVLAYHSTAPVMDYNCYYGAGAVTFLYANTFYSDLASLKAGTGQEVHGIYADPLFANPTGTTPASFVFPYTAPCASSGVNLSATFNVDFFHSPRPMAGVWYRGFYQNAPIGSIPANDATMPIFPKLYANVTSRYTKAFASVVYSLFYGIARALTQLAEIDYPIAIKQFNVNTASDEFLDLWGSWFGTKRYSDESDGTYSERIIKRVVDPRTIKASILNAVRAVDGVTYAIISEGMGGSFYVGYSYIGFQGAVDMEAKADFISDSIGATPFFFAVLVKVKDGTDYQRIIDAVNDTKGAGIRFAVQILPN